MNAYTTTSFYPYSQTADETRYRNSGLAGFQLRTQLGKGKS